MQQAESFIYRFRQNNKLAIRLISPTFGRVSPDILKQFGLTHRKTHYFFLFMREGGSDQRVDLQPFSIEKNELLFILPHQIHQLPAAGKGTDYFKLGFDEDCLAMLPKHYPFLVNPFNYQKVSFSSAAAERIGTIFRALQELLGTMDTDPELILAYLNSLLTEINAAYFSTGKNPADHTLSRYIHFRRFVEDNLTSHPTVKDIARTLGLNTNSLYSIVKHYSGMSPKEFITNRLMLEAKRHLYYSEGCSIKELSYELGYNDPEYFSRLFKKVTGKSIADFVQDLSGS